MKYPSRCHTVKCRMCGKSFRTTSPVRQYCGSDHCEMLRAVAKSVKRRVRRARLSMLGVKLHTAGNK